MTEGTITDATFEDGANPARVDIEYPSGLSRLMIFVKWLLAIPHYFALAVLGIVAYIAIVISWFAVLITGRYPRPLFDFVAGVFRWGWRVNAYAFHLQTDRYPPFSLADDPSYPVHVEIEYPDRVERWRPLVSWLLVIPAYVCAYVLNLVGFLVAFIAWFAILITGEYPRALFDIVTITVRWNLRVTTYMLWMNRQYPPFIWG